MVRNTPKKEPNEEESDGNGGKCVTNKYQNKGAHDKAICSTNYLDAVNGMAIGENAQS